MVNVYLRSTELVTSAVYFSDHKRKDRDTVAKFYQTLLNFEDKTYKCILNECEGVNMAMWITI